MLLKQGRRKKNESTMSEPFYLTNGQALAISLSKMIIVRRQNIQ